MKSSKGTRKASTSSRSSSSAPSGSPKKSNELTRAERRTINQAEHRRAQAEREAQRLAAPKKRRPARARVQVDTALGTFTEEVEGSAAMVKRVTGRAENKALAAVLVVGSALWAAPKVARWLSRR